MSIIWYFCAYSFDILEQFCKYKSKFFSEINTLNKLSQYCLKNKAEVLKSKPSQNFASTQCNKLETKSNYIYWGAMVSLSFFCTNQTIIAFCNPYNKVDFIIKIGKLLKKSEDDLRSKLFLLIERAFLHKMHGKLIFSLRYSSLFKLCNYIPQF